MRIRTENKDCSNLINSISFENFAFTLSDAFIFEIFNSLSVMAWLKETKNKTEYRKLNLDWTHNYLRIEEHVS